MNLIADRGLAAIVCVSYEGWKAQIRKDYELTWQSCTIKGMVPIA